MASSRSTSEKELPINHMLYMIMLCAFHVGALIWLCQRLKETDPTTIVEFVASENNTFEHVLIAYGCCIDEFLVGARHVLYIDGTFLSGPYKGTLL